MFYLTATKNREDLFIDISDILAQVIKASPTGDLNYLITAYGKPFTAAGFGNWFSDSCREAGLELSAHGLRKCSSIVAAEAGVTDNELNAFYGWNGDTSKIYTKRAKRKVLAKNAAKKIQALFPSMYALLGNGR